MPATACRRCGRKPSGHVPRKSLTAPRTGLPRPPVGSSRGRTPPRPRSRAARSGARAHGPSSGRHSAFPVQAGRRRIRHTRRTPRNRGAAPRVPRRLLATARRRRRRRPAALPSFPARAAPRPAPPALPPPPARPDARRGPRKYARRGRRPRRSATAARRRPRSTARRRRASSAPSKAFLPEPAPPFRRGAADNFAGAVPELQLTSSLRPLLDLLLQLLDAFLQPLDLRLRGRTQDVERLLYRRIDLAAQLVDRFLRLAEHPGHARGEILADALGLALTLRPLADQRSRLLGVEARNRFTTVADDLPQHAERHLRPLLLFLEDDLRQRDRGQVFLGAVVDDLHLGAALDHLGDLVERDVPALDRVVELSVRIPLDDLRFLLLGRRGGRSGLGRGIRLVLAHAGNSTGLPRK